MALDPNRWTIKTQEAFAQAMESARANSNPEVTPDHLLAHPADEFVARFVGADRGLKRLALRRLDEIELEPVDGGALPDAPRTPGSTTLRDALSLMMSEGADPLVVVAEDGRPIGLLSVHRIGRVLSAL